MTRPSRIEAYAIISADGMLADAQGHIPDSLKVEADQKFFHDGLAQAAALVHGRHSYEGAPDESQRYRLIATRTIAGLGREPARPRVLLWNPAGASFEEAWTTLASPPGTLAVLGGPEVYELFLGIGYDVFHLTRVPDVRLPGGRKVFPEIGADRSPEDVLASHSLRPGPRRVMDARLGVTLVSWER